MRRQVPSPANGIIAGSFWLLLSFVLFLAALCWLIDPERGANLVGFAVVMGTCLLAVILLFHY
jgi:hypothetical protein